jgi:hypothetical protein
MSKPVELIVTNELHRVAEQVETRPRMYTEASDAERAIFFEHLARALLCDIAHNAHIEVVANALAAIGVSGVGERFASVREARAEERRTLGIPEPAPETEDTSTSKIGEAIVSVLAEKLGAALGPGIAVTPIKVGGGDK